MSHATTSLLITSSKYAQDIMNLLCLPEGVDYRFRYRAKWIPPEVMKDPSILRGTKAAIVFFYGSKPSEQLREFVPILEVQIDDAEALGDILYLQFTTGKLYEYDLRNSGVDPSPSSALIEKLLKDFLRDKEPALERLFVLDAQNLPRLADDQLASWTRLIQRLWHLEPFQGGLFLRIVRLIDQTGIEVPPNVLVSKGKFITRGYALRGGSTYQLELLQRTSDDVRLVQHFEIVLKTPEQVIPIRNALVVGEYDKLDLIFSVKNQLGKIHSSLGIEAKGQAIASVREDEKDAEIQLTPPEVHVPIAISRISFRVPILLIVAGFLGGPFLGAINKWAMLGLSDLALSTTTILGVVLVAVGASLFRKIG